MKTSLRKLVATVGGLAIAAMLPVSMMASAEGVGVAFTTDKQTVKAGDTVTVSVNVSGLSKENPWNIMTFKLGYDANQLEPQMQYNEVKDEDAEFLFGSAVLRDDTIGSVTFKDASGAVVNPIEGGIISTTNQKNNGEIMTIKFKVKDGVKDGDKLTLKANLTQLAKAVIEDGQAKDPAPLTSPATSDVVLTVGNTAPTDTTSTPSTGSTTGSTDNTTNGTDNTTNGSVDDTTTTTDDVVVPTNPTDNNTNPPTGESTTLFVVALVLMAGSAIALVGMKKKVFSK